MALVHPTAWAMFASNGEWQNARHFDFLADRIMAMRRGELKRLCVSWPPGHGKSEYLSLYVPSWWIATRPRDRAIVASYGKKLPMGWSERARDLLAAYGPEVFGVTANSRESVKLWHPRDPATGRAHRGFYFPVGVGGGVMGRRAELLVLDDITKNAKEARSERARDAAWAFFDKDAMTRLLPHSCVIKIGTRWHPDDTFGRLEKKQARGEVEEPWEFLNFPAIAGDDDPMGREPGEALWPEMWPVDALLRKKRGRDPATWEALFQGRPVAEGGATFRTSWERTYEELNGVLVAGELRVPRGRLKIFSTVDLAGSKKQRADWTVIATWGIDHVTRTLWLLDIVRKRLEAPQIVAALREVQARLKPTVFYMERAAPQLNLLHKLKFAEQAGQSYDPGDDANEVVFTTAIEMGLPILGLDPGSTDKITRSGPAQAVMAAGKLLTPERAPWLSEWKAEVFDFPESKKDDQVDTLSYAAQIFLEVLVQQGQSEESHTFDRVIPFGE